MQHLLLLLLSLTPGIILLIIILFMDRREPEPLGFVLFAILLGACCCIPAGFIEIILMSLPVFKLPVIGGILSSFLVIAPAEELAKLAVVMLFIFKNKNFNEENDGIVYVGASALGFAMLENVFYVFTKGGFGIGIARALTSVPSHCFSAVIMGYFVGLAKFATAKKESWNLIKRGFFYAWLLHGVYDAVIFAIPLLAVIAVPGIVIFELVFGIKYLKLGRLSSIKRWETSGTVIIPLEQEKIIDESYVYKKYKPDDVVKDNEGRFYLKPKKIIWKTSVSRTFFTLSFLLWLLFIVVYLDQPVKVPERLDLYDLNIKYLKKLTDLNDKNDLCNAYIIFIPDSIRTYDFENIIKKTDEEGNAEFKKAYIKSGEYYSIKSNIEPYTKAELAYILYNADFITDDHVYLNELNNEQNRHVLDIIKKTTSFLSLSDLIIAGTVLTVFPVLIGILLEISYFRRKNKKIYIK